MTATSRLPGTVFRSSAEWPCTSALGLFTRKYSAGKSKRSPPSNVTVKVFRSLCRRNSVGQACGSVIDAHLKCEENLTARGPSFYPKRRELYAKIRHSWTAVAGRHLILPIQSSDQLG